MSPQQSIFTSLFLWIGGVAVGWAIKVGIIPAEDQTQAVTVVVAALGGLASIAFAWWKARKATRDQLIKSVNSDMTNGVRVVPATVPEAIAPTVNSAIK